ncbi:hypothetical protein D3C86_2160550 [compost metagenome]
MPFSNSRSTKTAVICLLMEPITNLSLNFITVFFSKSEKPTDLEYIFFELSVINTTPLKLLLSKIESIFKPKSVSFLF